MSHARTQIRAAAVARLTGLATTAGRVHASRMRPGDALPCLLISTNDEDIAPGSIGRLYEREVLLIVRGFAKANDALDDVLDQIALEVETAMAADHRAALDKIETDFDDTLQQPVGSIALTYRVTYFTAADTSATML